MTEILLLSSFYMLFIIEGEREILNKVLIIKVYVSLVCVYFVLFYSHEVSQVLGMLILLSSALLSVALLRTKNSERS